jgi:hypothetical protein
LPGQPAGITSVRAFTSSSDGYWQAADLTITNGTVAIAVPGYAVATLYGVAPPALQAKLDGPGSLLLSWPRAAVGYILQSSLSPDGAAGWKNDTNALSITSGIATVSVDVTTSPRFYRLILP